MPARPTCATSGRSAAATPPASGSSRRLKLRPRADDLHCMSAIAVPRSAVVEARTSLALASLSAGLIHVMAGFHHWSEWWLFGVGMFVMAITQLGAAAAL